MYFKNGFVFIWIVSLLTLTVVTSYSLSKRIILPVLVEEEERPTGSNSLEEMHWKVLLQTSSHDSDLLSNHDDDIKRAPAHGHQLLYDLFFSQANDIPPEFVG